mmetsp:Transcript_130059/g.224821  ORF Transcript_130059/g.224821 Transcript_130059/m.224821 type:complete len:262 (-) Transcript_130059:302-1087(-)
MGRLMAVLGCWLGVSCVSVLRRLSIVIDPTLPQLTPNRPKQRPTSSLHTGPSVLRGPSPSMLRCPERLAIPDRFAYTGWHVCVPRGLYFKHSPFDNPFQWFQISAFHHPSFFLFVNQKAPQSPQDSSIYGCCGGEGGFAGATLVLVFFQYLTNTPFWARDRVEFAHCVGKPSRSKKTFLNTHEVMKDQDSTKKKVIKPEPLSLQGASADFSGSLGVFQEWVDVHPSLKPLTRPPATILCGSWASTNRKQHAAAVGNQVHSV